MQWEPIIHQWGSSSLQMLAVLLAVTICIWVTWLHWGARRDQMGDPTRQHADLHPEKAHKRPHQYLSYPRVLSRGRRIQGHRRRHRCLPVWGAERQRRHVRLALRPELHPDESWTPRHRRRWWRKGVTRLARARWQEQSRGSQTAGVSYHDPEYYDLAEAKGLVLHMTTTYGANQRFPAKVTKGRLPLTAAYPQGEPAP